MNVSKQTNCQLIVPWVPHICYNVSFFHFFSHPFLIMAKKKMKQKIATKQIAIKKQNKT